MAGAGVAGGLVALLAVALVDPGAQLTHIDSLVVMVGILAGIGLDRVARA